MIYTLPSLNHVNPADVEGILANLTLGMLPNPGISDEPSLPTELRDRLVHEIRIRLRLKRDDTSPKAMAKIYDLLAKEIERVALAKVDIKEIRSRLGQRGDLAPSLYTIIFMDSFSGSKERGVRQGDVERTLRTPDSVEHLNPELLGMTRSRATSLYLKEFRNDKTPRNSYSLLVFCTRIGYKQQVGDAWQIFHSDVNITQAKTPLDVLRILVRKYGFEFKLGEKTGSFFWHERVQIKDPSKPNTFLEIPKRPSVDMAVTWSPGRIEKNVLEVTYAFGINNTAYEADLREHGIIVKHSAPQLSTRP